LRTDAASHSPGRRRVVAGAAGAAVLSCLGGCTEPLPPLRVGTIVFPGYEFLFLARESGLLPPREVRLVELLSSSDNLRLMEEGGLDATACTLDEVMSVRSRGMDLRIVAVLDVSDGADAVMARAGISRPEDLRGRRVGEEDTAMGAVLFDAVLEAASLRVEDVVKVPITADQSVGMFHSSLLDAVVTFEPWVSQLEGLGAVRVYDSTRVPDRIVDVLAVRSDAIVKRPDAVRRLVAAHFQALARFRADQKAASKLMAPRLQLKPEEVPSGFRGLRLPDEAANREMLRKGGRFEQVAQDLQRVLVERRLLDRSTPFDSLADPRFIPGA
jgi:NitT/TauT family transport system substrate-binding protein